MTMRIIDLAFHHIEELDPDRLEESKKSDATIVVTADTPAAEVADQAVKMNSSLILVTPENDQSIVGLIEPDWVLHQIRKVQGEDLADLSEAVRHLSAVAKPPKAGYEHEWLNFERPQLVWCAKGGHYVYNLPCRSHSTRG